MTGAGLTMDRVDGGEARAGERVHLAVIDPRYASAILMGMKTIESRFSRTRRVPFGQVLAIADKSQALSALGHEVVSIDPYEAYRTLVGGGRDLDHDLAAAGAADGAGVDAPGAPERKH